MTREAGVAPTISIVLASYNGAAYIQEQIDSLLRQTWQDFELVVCDDRSTDQTVDLVNSYADRLRVKVYRNPTTLGPIGNFGHGVEHAAGRYVAFCDQDDVWCSERLQDSLELMRQLETMHSIDTPLLVHSDLQVVNATLEPIAPSYHQLSGFTPHTHPFERLLMQNVVTGSTCLMNRALVELAFPIPTEAIMHDWWVALVAKAVGHIGYSERAPILYRQHSANVVGAVRRGKSPVEWVRKLVSFSWSNKRYQQALSGRVKQAQALQRRIGHRLPESTLHRLKLFSELLEQSFFRKRMIIVSNGFRRGNLGQDLEMLLRI